VLLELGADPNIPDKHCQSARSAGPAATQKSFGSPGAADRRRRAAGWVPPVAQFLPSCFEERCPERTLPDGQPPVPGIHAEVLAAEIQFTGVVVRGLGHLGRADEFNDFLGQPYGVHLLDELIRERQAAGRRGHVL
jgi:hypothetical protein